MLIENYIRKGRSVNMKRLLLKSVSLIFAVCLFLSTGTSVLAASVEPVFPQVTLENASEIFANMTNDELNDFIDRIAEAYTTSTKSSKLVSTNSVQSGYDPLQLAWLAAA
jgi:hypothetical protein